MTFKERMLAAVRGEGVDELPWAPRLDLWYRANSRAGTLPGQYRGASLREIVEDMGVGMHAVVPDFRDLRGPEDEVDRALGIYNLKSMPYGTVLENVERVARYEGDTTKVEYLTPAGRLTTRVLYDERMREAGVSLTHVSEHLIKSVDDFEAAGYLFENAGVLPNYEGYSEFASEVGDRGLAVGFVSLAASPMHLIQRELMPLDQFFYAMHDCPEALARLAERIEVYWRQVMDVAVNCPAEVIFVGANYDASVTHPPFFREHILPWLQTYSKALHERGKYLLTHTDGENTGLLQCYLDAETDVADSICPAPMTKLSFGEVREAFAGRVTIMGGIPSIALLKSSMSDYEFDAFLDDFFLQIGSGDRLILGISDTTPPGADFGRLVRIGRRAKEFGLVMGAM